MDILKEGERFDDLGNNRKIIQHAQKYCFTSDAVALANSVKAHAGDTVVDLGCGSGIIAILTALQTKAARVIGVEIQPDMADMANRSVLLNNLSPRVQILNEKIQNIASVLGHGSTDVVVANPPYRKAGTGEKSENTAIALSRSEVAVTLEEVVTAAAKLLRFGGKFFLIHQSERLAEIIFCMKTQKIEPKALRFLNPQTVIIEAAKGGKEGLVCYI